MVVDDSEDGSDIAEADNDDGEDTFMESYSDVLNNELKSTTINKSFVQAKDESSKKVEVFFLFEDDISI